MNGFAAHPFQRRVKAGLDVVLALVGLVVLSPGLLGIAAWILAESGRPVLFVRPRAGKDGVPFPMLKFRTMVPDALDVNRRLGLTQDPFGVVAGDPRITRSGRFLRRTGLDEAPQLLNVLAAQMSLVGPRPDLVEQAANYSPEDAERLTVKPGLTGWAQIHGRDEMTWPERFVYDRWYIENWSLALDLRILVRTFGQLIRAEPVPAFDAMNVERARSPRAPQGRQEA